MCDLPAAETAEHGDSAFARCACPTRSHGAAKPAAHSSHALTRRLLKDDVAERHHRVSTDDKPRCLAHRT